MRTEAKNNRRQILENVTHYITAFVVFLKGMDKIGIPGKTAFGVIFVVIALFIFLGTLFHHKAEKILGHFKAYIFVCEAFVVGMVGYLYVKEGKHLISYAYFFASFMFVIAFLVYAVTQRRQNKVH